jgi:hypothetical protein
MRAACGLFQGGKSEGQGIFVACHEHLAARSLAVHAAASLHDLAKQYYEGAWLQLLSKPARGRRYEIPFRVNIVVTISTGSDPESCRS